MAKNLRICVLLIPFILSIPLWLAKKKRQNSTTYILSRYADMNDGAIRAEHIQVQELQNSHNPVVLRTNWFPLRSSQGICAPASEVRADGSAEAWVDACGPTNRHPLTNVSIEKLFSELRLLPPSQQLPNQNYAIILTFCVDENCTTRVYNRANLPNQVSKIYQLINAHLEKLLPLLISGVTYLTRCTGSKTCDVSFRVRHEPRNLAAPRQRK